MNLSMNEVEAMAKKATRGAGYPWGLAEEAGKATRWLCENSIDGCAALRGVLEHFDGTSTAEIAPIIQSDDWHAASGTLCPVTAGATLSDLVNLRTVRLHNVIQPVFLVPFAAGSALVLGETITLTIEDHEDIKTNGREVVSKGSPPAQSSFVSVSIGLI